MHIHIVTVAVGYGMVGSKTIYVCYMISRHICIEGIIIACIDVYMQICIKRTSSVDVNDGKSVNHAALAVSYGTYTCTYTYTSRMQCTYTYTTHMMHIRIHIYIHICNTHSHV